MARLLGVEILMVPLEEKLALDCSFPLLFICESMFLRSFDLVQHGRRCRKSYHRDNWLVAAKIVSTSLFDPSMSALPIIVVHPIIKGNVSWV